MSEKPIRAVIVGAGIRAMRYSMYAIEHPEDMMITGVVEPDALRRKKAAELHKIPPENCFCDVSELVKRERIGDACINGTMDRDHCRTSIPVLEKGYDLLLEKPMTATMDELTDITRSANRCGNKVMICHVLRYAPFYAEIKKRVLAGEIGRIVNIRTLESVCYHHMATAFIRGKWSNKNESTTFLISKCCHDLDLIAWYMNETRPVTVASFGSLMEFNRENAPAGSGARCVPDCGLERACQYSAKKIYIERAQYPNYVWRSLQHIDSPTEEDKLRSLESDNPYGRCVWKCGANIVDHQSVIIGFENGATASHTLVSPTPRPYRRLSIVGTQGEIDGIAEDNEFIIKYPDPYAPTGAQQETVKTEAGEGAHGGGDMKLMEDFVRVMQGGGASISTTHINDSIYAYLIGFSADRAMEENRVIAIPRPL